MPISTTFFPNLTVDCQPWALIKILYLDQVYTLRPKDCMPTKKLLHLFLSVEVWWVQSNSAKQQALHLVDKW